MFVFWLEKGLKLAASKFTDGLIIKGQQNFTHNRSVHVCSTNKIEILTPTDILLISKKKIKYTYTLEVKNKFL